MTKKPATKSTPTLKQTNLKNMFAQAASQVLNKAKEKVLDDADKGNEGEDSSDEESEVELPMKPPSQPMPIIPKRNLQMHLTQMMIGIRRR